MQTVAFLHGEWVSSSLPEASHWGIKGAPKESFVDITVTCKKKRPESYTIGGHLRRQITEPSHV